jgi:subtilisin family serine protease
VAGQTNGIGAAPGSELCICRALDDAGQGTSISLMRCAQFVANVPTACPWLPKVRIWSASLGVPDIGYTFFHDAIKSMIQLNVLPVFAAGNSGQAGCGTMNYPGSHPDVLTVGAVSCDSLVTYFSSRGPVNSSSCSTPNTCCGYVKPDVAGPGDRIVSASHSSNNGYVIKSGTSQATPFAAAVAAMYLSIGGNNAATSAAQLKQVVIDTTNKPVPDGRTACATCGSFPTRPNNEVGSGLVDALTAVYHNYG